MHSYAEVLKTLRINTNPADINIKSIRRAKNGALLLKLAKGEEITEKFSEAIRSSLMDTADMREV